MGEKKWEMKDNTFSVYIADNASGGRPKVNVKAKINDVEYPTANDSKYPLGIWVKRVTGGVSISGPMDQLTEVVLAVMVKVKEIQELAPDANLRSAPGLASTQADIDECDF